MAFICMRKTELDRAIPPPKLSTGYVRTDRPPPAASSSGRLILLSLYRMKEGDSMNFILTQWLRRACEAFHNTEALLSNGVNLLSETLALSAYNKFQIFS